VSRRFPGADGQKVTDFFNIVAWRGLADTCNKYLAKGKKAAIVGELQARTYTAKDGTTRMSLDVSADEVEFLSPKEEPKEAPRATTPADPNTFEDVSSDDLPF
jgi:single-strand DNA-binding protein